MEHEKREKEIGKGTGKKMKKTKHKSWVTILDEKSYINFFISHLGEKKWIMAAIMQ